MLLITDVQDGGDRTYVTVDGQNYELSKYHGGDDLACIRCGLPEAYDADGECLRALYTSLNDMWLCSDCLDQAEASETTIRHIHEAITNGVSSMPGEEYWESLTYGDANWNEWIIEAQRNGVNAVIKQLNSDD